MNTEEYSRILESTENTLEYRRILESTGEY
jgi:hypothetical protein